MRLGYLGPEGTFSEEAVRSAPEAANAELVALPTVRDTIMAVDDGTVQRAVVPIENALEGAVAVTFDTLADDEADVLIVGEVVIAVSPCLIARDGIAFDEIERVISHPQATSQCARFLRERLPQAVVASASSTAEAVRIVATSDEPWAALGTRRAAELYGASVLADAVADEPGNATRFVWLAREAGPCDPSRPSKTSLTFWGAGDTTPGWLVRCLSEFAFRGVNLTKIESRPLRAKLGHYRFFVDCEGDAREGVAAEAVQGLRKHCERVRILGSYPVAD
ncbi:MAG: prephenate dehydratase [Solirubrobacteraceae bacterium]|jgi:prephenate dehydratase|nr:prephenate dehydratase [Solirubrobacteraceae bacterium]MEA2189171.1 prephenate dehydratase [Solirubrobacteraceae bacterium]